MSRFKECKDCGETKPLGEFYTHPGMSDGHLNICKKCNIRKIVGIRQVYYVTSNPRAPSELEPDCDMIVAEQVMHS